MKLNKILSLGLSMLFITLFSACSQDELTDNGNSSAIGQLIEFNANDGAMFAGLRAADQGDITPLPTGYRFALRMYYDNRNTTTNTEYNALENVFMQVSSEPENIRCIYTDNYDPVTYNAHAETAPKLYWNNRKNHGFVGFFLNNDPTNDKPTLVNKESLTFDLDYREKDGKVFQYDPMLAVKQQAPTSGNNLANRVYLVFEHQAACVEVNVNTDKVSVEPLPAGGGESGEQAVITQIRLLGTAKQITVYTKMDKDGNIVKTTDDGTDEIVQDFVSSDKKDVKQNCYSLPSEEEIEEEKEDGSVEKGLILSPLYSKFDDATKDKVKANYNATARGLAFGELKGLRIVWKEKRTGTEEVEEVEHDITYDFIDNSGKENYQKLLSGKKYIYNVTLRRGTIATINLKIVDWVDDEAKDYEADGIIVPHTPAEGGDGE